MGTGGQRTAGLVMERESFEEKPFGNPLCAHCLNWNQSTLKRFSRTGLVERERASFHVNIVAKENSSSHFYCSELDFPPYPTLKEPSQPETI